MLSLQSDMFCLLTKVQECFCPNGGGITVLILQPGLELQHTINVVKAKALHLHTVKAYISGCMAPLILNLITRWR